MSDRLSEQIDVGVALKRRSAVSLPSNWAPEGQAGGGTNKSVAV